MVTSAGGDRLCVSSAHALRVVSVSCVSLAPVSASIANRSLSRRYRRTTAATFLCYDQLRGIEREMAGTRPGNLETARRTFCALQIYAIVLFLRGCAHSNSVES